MTVEYQVLDDSSKKSRKILLDASEFADTFQQCCLPFMNMDQCGTSALPQCKHMRVAFAERIEIAWQSHHVTDEVRSRDRKRP